MGILDAPSLITPHHLRRQQSYLRGQAPIANRLMGSGSLLSSAFLSDGTHQASMNRVQSTILADAHDLRIVLGNYSYGTAGPNTIFATVAIEVDQGNAGSNSDNVAHPALFGGLVEVTIPPDSCVISDAIPIRVLKGQTVYLRTRVRVGTLGEKWPGTTLYKRTAFSDKVVPDGTDQVVGVGAPSGTETVSQYIRDFGPLAVLGTVAPTARVFAAFGDSISVGMNDAQDANQRGWIERGLNDQYPLVNVSRHTEAVNQMVPAVFATFTPVAYRHKLRFIDGATHVFATYGVNDTGGSDTQATIQANLLALWTELVARGLKVWTYTMPPRTTSTDSWATTGNQTISGASTNTKRIAINDWIRDGAPIDATSKAAVAVGTSSNVLRAGAAAHPLKGYVETADTVETARNSGIWKAAYTDDGLHPLTVGHTAMGAALAAALPAIVAS